MTIYSLAKRKYFIFFFILIFSNTLTLCLCGKTPEKSSSIVESRRQSRAGSDLAAASSIAVNNYKTQSVAARVPAPASNGRYGYPYQVAPTLGPFRRSDDAESETSSLPQTVSVSKAKPYGSRLAGSEEDSSRLKKGAQKKHKVSHTYSANRRQGYDEERDSSAEKSFRAYREPKYRNFDELETVFMPRSIHIGSPYSDYDYSKSPRRPGVSPRDPYLSPSSDPSDSFYPAAPKEKSYSAYGQRPHARPAYGAGNYDEPHDYHSGHIHSSYEEGSYDTPASKYPSSSGGPYDYREDYAIESNKPITGDIRKRLLQYAGASDLYEGEPDYLRQLARNKFKYGNIGNDYNSYSGPGYRGSYSDFPYVESKIRVVKKSRA